MNAPGDPAGDAPTRGGDAGLDQVIHDLRSPLNAILGWTHVLLRMKTLDPAVREGLETIARNARDQARVIDALAARGGQHRGG